MRCAHVDRVLALALGTLLVCGVINTVVAVIEQAWWAWGVGGACLTAAAVVAAKWFPPPRRAPLPRATAGPSPEPVRTGLGNSDAAA
ncbi:hypothetical protein [Umezawaea sp. Da 62-37]|uniref:hypothetical protein n=1 Tax=Umezawaea sp. Da 62-37 TaxID=3075927 RepID=UPI0028F731E6|nr:hypothetical protein [Umezawaea sp. Da 62-37]WNV87143.1 hypothetical protein RM788_02285 [Umezawaea sp. Da 62-37]